VQPLILDALQRVSHQKFELIKSADVLPKSEAPLLQFTAYEALNFDHASEHPETSLLCAYVIRKALIRKHYLSNTVSTYLVKHPDSVLGKHFKPAIHFELDFAEFLDEALFDAWDLNESMERNENIGQSGEREWWILKPGMSDGGNGIRLFSTMQELQSIFEEWEGEERDEEDEEDEEDDDIGADEDKEDEENSGDRAMTSQLRHFIAQPYIDSPLLLPAHDNRKFHIRVYVLAVGALKVYVYKEMLALFAAKTYQSPNTVNSEGDQEAANLDLSQHLTNTCFQDESTRDSSVHRFWSLNEPNMPSKWQDDIFDQICTVTGEVFEAAAREQMVHFQALPNAFEIFGVDFLVDAERNVWLLELNAYPDFKQTGKELQDVVVGGLFEEVVKVAVQPFFGDKKDEDGTEKMKLVRSVDLGRR
jgi:tubulin---tyrosine ligase